MKRLLITFCFLIGLAQVKGQEQKNIADLDFLYQKIQELPSYKDQLKGNLAYIALYQRLRKELNTSDEFEVYKKLIELISPLKDNHLGLYHSSDSSYKFAYLNPKADLSVLEKKFAATSKDSIEGIYYLGFNQDHKYVLYKHEKEVYYLRSLQKGYVEAVLYKTAFGSFDAIQFVRSPRYYQLSRNVKLSNEVLNGLPFRKAFTKDFRSVDKSSGNYEYKNINEKIGYLRLSSFYSSDVNIKKATEFFNAVKSEMNQQNLLVDIRDNSGGGFNVSGQFIDYLWKYPGKVYVLQNSLTASNAEKFILNVRKRKEITTFGETTVGTLTYGSNTGKLLVFPSNRFVFYPTDTKGPASELAYESIGIPPDIFLDPFSKDWIEQTLSYIK
jgi:hypothetical protein